PKSKQLTIHKRGGARRGAGRKPKGPQSLVPHRERTELEPRFPVLVTQTVLPGLPNLRRRAELGVICGAFEKARERFGMRLIHFSIQSNHIHMIVEASDKRSLWRGMQGLGVRIAKRL